MHKRIKTINIKGNKIVVDLTDGSQVIYPLSNYKGFTYNSYYFYYNGRKFSEMNKTLEDFEKFLNSAPESNLEEKPGSIPSDAIQISNWEEI